jgi:hypothetical protein
MKPSPSTPGGKARAARPKERLMTVVERMERGVERTKPKDSRLWVERFKDIERREEAMTNPSSSEAEQLKQLAIEMRQRGNRLCNADILPQDWIDRAADELDALALRSATAPLPANARAVAEKIDRALATYADGVKHGEQYYLHGLWKAREIVAEVTASLPADAPLPATARSEPVAIPYHEQVREAALYLENGSGGADYIAWSMSKEILRLADECAKAPLSETAPSGTAKESPYDDPLFVAVDAAHDKDERQRMHDQGVREGLHPPVPPKHKPVA